MFGITTKFGRNTIILFSSIAIALSGCQSFENSEEKLEVKDAIKEHKIFSSVLLSIEAAGKSLDRDEEIPEPIGESLRRSVPLLQELQQFPQDTTAYTFSPDGRNFLTGHKDGSIRFWEFNGRPIDRAAIQTQQGDRANEIWQLVFDRDGEKLFVRNSAGEVQIWNVAGSNPTLSQSWSLGKFSGRLYVSRDGEVVVAVGGDKGGEIGIWDSKGNLIRAPKQAHWVSITDVAFTTDGEFITSDIWGRVRRWSRRGQALDQLGEAFEGGHDSHAVLAITFPEDWGNKFYLRVNRDSISKASFTEEVKTPLDRNTIELYLPIYLADVEGIRAKKIYALILERGSRGNLSPNGEKLVLNYGYVSADESTWRGLAQVWSIYGNRIGDPIQEKGAIVDAVSPSGYFVAGRVRNNFENDRTSVRLWLNYSSTSQYMSPRVLLNEACKKLQFHSVLKNPVTETEKNAANTCKLHGGLDSVGTVNLEYETEP